MFWLKQAFWTNAFLFGFGASVPYLDHPLLWLFLLTFILFTWIFHNQPIDETGTIGNRHRDLRPVFMALGIACFSIGYFHLGAANRAPYAITFGLDIAFLPMLAVEACRSSEATKKGYLPSQTTYFLTPTGIALVLAGAVWVATPNVRLVLYILVVAQCLQLAFGALWDYHEYVKTHRSPFVSD